MTKPIHPEGRYVAVYGSYGQDWRARVQEILDASGVPWHDPSDPRWDKINFDNGDQMQDLVDELVRDEHEALLRAGCAVFHFAGGQKPPLSLATRFEIGLLSGCRVPGFVHVAPEALGRNYIWAAIRQYPHLVRCSSLEEAALRSVDWWLSNGPRG